MLHCSSARAKGPGTQPFPSSTARAERATTDRPGILTATTLQCILSASVPGTRRRGGRQGGCYDGGDGDDVDADISPYDPRYATANARDGRIGGACTPSGRHELFRSRNVTKKERKRSHSRRLQPMVRISSPPSPLPPRNAEPSRIPPATLTGSRNQGGSARDVRAQPSSSQEPPSQQQPLHQQPRMHPRQVAIAHDTRNLHSEIQWIHQHLPVLKLATSKCSLKLRQQLFVSTLSAHVARAQLRDRWYHWTWVVTQEKQLEFAKMSASRLIIEVCEALSMDIVVDKFRYWKAWMLEGRRQEQLAAAVTLQRFLRYHHERDVVEASERAAFDIKQALETMNARVTLIQRSYQTHVHVRRLQRCLHAARRIQGTVRSHQRHTRFLQQAQAAVRIQRVYRSFVDSQQLTLSATVAHTLKQHRARTIQRYWRSYAAWKHYTLPPLCLGYLVDQVEYVAAIESIRRHILGFLCRRHMQMYHRSARRIQLWWRSVQERPLARRKRRVVLLHRNLAACCLQRTFARNREQLKFRQTMQKSAQPMYLRARHFDARLRARCHRLIVQSAVYVMQSSWRKHVRYVAWKQQRTRAALLLQHFLKRAVGTRRWHLLVQNATRCHRDEKRRNAVRRIQTCWRRYESREAKNGNAACLQRIDHLAGLMRAAICIQRYYRRRHDRWRRLLRLVLGADLPRERNAANRIRKQWLDYYARKQAVLHQFGGGLVPPSQGMNLGTLQQLLLEKQRQDQWEQAAAKRIQKMFRRAVDRRNGKVLLKKYRTLMRQEMKKRQQRQIIHGYLDEKDRKRAQKQQKKNTSVAATASSPSSLLMPVVHDGTTNAKETTLPPLDAGAAETWSPETGASESVQYWSDEYQRAYLYNARTGESTWL